jgi:hypothetical protein
MLQLSTGCLRPKKDLADQESEAAQRNRYLESSAVEELPDVAGGCGLLTPLTFSNAIVRT